MCTNLTFINKTFFFPENQLQNITQKQHTQPLASIASFSPTQFFSFSSFFTVTVSLLLHNHGWSCFSVVMSLSCPFDFLLTQLSSKVSLHLIFFTHQVLYTGLTHQCQSPPFHGDALASAATQPDVPAGAPVVSHTYPYF